jgi:hypothetical protein
MSHTRTLGSLKSHLLPALQPFSAILESVPTSEADIQLYEEKIAVEGAESQGELRLLDKDPQNKSLVVLGWPRWKRVFVRYAYRLFPLRLYTLLFKVPTPPARPPRPQDSGWYTPARQTGRLSL